MTRLLVVDDHADHRSLLAEFLRQQNFRVFVACDGLDGVNKARAVRPDLVLMDIKMPGCDGLTACRSLKADPVTSGVPLIFLTASSQPEERVAGLEAGAIDYITKPFHFDEVKLRVALHLRLDGIANEVKSNVGPHPLDSDATNIDLALFRQVQSIVLSNFADEPDVEALAARIGTSPRRLSLAVKRSIGLTVFDYIREQRLKESRRLLLESNSDIVTIARAVGYTNGANFATAFKARFGVSPSMLRRTGTHSNNVQTNS
ncbi:TPA: response regulator [Burkholderia vietnamiensis]|nr:response regulator [Burkholderia vietnamiensis]